jgi:quercetin dioxygenase-like cupin family protein
MNSLGDKLVVSQPGDAVFESDGLRPYFRYRKLGIEGATAGRVGAHVIHAERAVGREQGVHTHTLDFQLVYILRGTARFHYEGHGEVDCVAGTSIYQPPGIRHEVLECSADCEILEITMPADFPTHAA